MRWITGLPLLAVLAGCGGERHAVDEQNASTAEVAQAVREAGGGDVRFRPGRWEARVTLDEITAPGLPAGMADSMKQAMAGRTASVTCLTAQEAAKPAADFFGVEQAKNCRYDHFRMGEGQIDAQLTCNEAGATQVMTMQGRYDPNSYRMNMTADMKAGAGAAAMGPQSMTMKMRIEARHAGQCTGKENA